MNEIIRFDWYFRGGRYEMLPSLDGRYMRFDDHSKVNARIAELTAEVANLRDALHVIAENESWRSGNTDQAVARNALKEGL